MQKEPWLYFIVMFHFWSESYHVRGAPSQNVYTDDNMIAHN